MNKFTNWLQQHKVGVITTTVSLVLVIGTTVGIIKSEPRYWHLQTEGSTEFTRGKAHSYVSYTYDKKEEILRLTWKQELSSKQLKYFNKYEDEDEPTVVLTLLDKDMFKIGSEVKLYKSDCISEDKNLICRAKIKHSKENQLQMVNLLEAHKNYLDMSNKELFWL